MSNPCVPVSGPTRVVSGCCRLQTYPRSGVRVAAGSLGYSGALSSGPEPVEEWEAVREVSLDYAVCLWKE